MSLASLFGEETLNEHEIAWRTRNWDSVKALAETFKEKPENEFFFILNQINSTKKRLGMDDIESYSKYAVDSMLSKHIDCIQHVYNMNLLGEDISDQMHFDYLLHAVRPAKRFGGPGEIVDPVETMANQVFCAVVAKFYEVNVDRAAEYVEHFSPEQIKILKKRLYAVVDDAFVSKACPRANKTNIAKILKEVEKWNK